MYSRAGGRKTQRARSSAVAAAAPRSAAGAARGAQPIRTLLRGGGARPLKKETPLLPFVRPNRQRGARHCRFGLSHRCSSSCGRPRRRRRRRRCRRGGPRRRQHLYLERLEREAAASVAAHPPSGGSPARFGRHPPGERQLHARRRGPRGRGGVGRRRRCRRWGGSRRRLAVGGRRVVELPAQLSRVAPRAKKK